MKACFKCGAEKPLSDFYKHPKMADGHVNKCKECNKRDVYENREARKDYYLVYDRNRPNREERAIKDNERRRLKYATDPEYRRKILETKALWDERNKLKRRAHCAVSNALRDGKIFKPTSCEHCGTSEKKIQAHHWSYAPEHWLDVIWLCTRCHGKEHRRLNELGRDPDKIIRGENL